MFSVMDLSGPLTTNSVIAVVPMSMVMVPFPISRDPDVVNPSAPIAGAMDVIRLIVNPNGDLDCVNGWY